MTEPGRIDERTVPRRRRDLAAVEVGGETVLLDAARGVASHLGPTATVVWHCLDGESSIAGVADDVVAALGVPRDAAIADLRRLVERFARTGLLAHPRAPGTRSTATRRRPAGEEVVVTRDGRTLVTVPPDE